MGCLHLTTDRSGGAAVAVGESGALLNGFI